MADRYSSECDGSDQSIDQKVAAKKAGWSLQSFYKFDYLGKKHSLQCTEFICTQKYLQYGSSAKCCMQSPVPGKKIEIVVLGKEIFELELNNYSKIKAWQWARQQHRWISF